MDSNNSTNKAKIIGVKRGVVASDKADKTVVVAVDTLKTHSKYLKKYIHTKKYIAHDPQNKCKVGDKVTIIPCRPVSKRKRYKVVY